MLPTENTAEEDQTDFDDLPDDPAETARKVAEIMQAAIDRDVELLATCAKYRALDRLIEDVAIRAAEFPLHSKERQVNARFAKTIGAECEQMLEEIIGAISVTKLGEEAKARVLRYLQPEDLPPDAPARDRLALSLATDLATDDDP